MIHRRPLFLLVVAGLSALGSRLPAMTGEDQQVFDHIFKELRYGDTAWRYLLALEKKTREPDALAEIAYLKSDVLKAMGKTEEGAKALEEAQRKYPKHVRAALGNLEAIENDYKAVLELFARALREPEKAKAQALRAEAEAAFTEKVEKPLDALIADRQKKLEEAKQKDSPPKEKAEESIGKRGRPKPKARIASTEIDNLTKSLQYSQVVRLQFYLGFARQLEAGSPKRAAVLEKGRKLAEEFVDAPTDYPSMQHEAALHSGLFSFELGNYESAEERLSDLYAISPGGTLTASTVAQYKDLRLRAVLYGARARNATRAYDKAEKIIRTHCLEPPKDKEKGADPIDISKADEDKEHQALGVLVKLEYAIALVGAGKTQQGLDLISKSIGRADLTEGLRTDCRKALARVAQVGSVKLRGRDYYEAAIGLKSESRFEEALDMLQTALSRLNPKDSKEMKEYAPRCLSEIGQIQRILGRFVESALAYREVCMYFPTASRDVLAESATNFLAMSARAIKFTEGGASHTGLATLKKEAANAFEKYGNDGGDNLWRTIIFDAKNLEAESKWDEAKRKYLEVPPEKDGRRVSLYFFAQANAWRCVYQKWDHAPEDKKKDIEPELDEAQKALADAVPKALKAADKLGASTAAITLGQIHFYAKSDMAAAAKALQPFAGELKDEATFRCFGMGLLVIAEARSGALDDGAKHFKDLFGACKLEPVVSYAAHALWDGYAEAKNEKEASRYALIYAVHPESKKAMEDPHELARVARALIDGGKVEQAQKYIDLIRAKGGDADAALDRLVIWLEAQLLAHSKEWDKVIAKLETYVQKYKPQLEDKSEEDAYVLRDLAEAYLARSVKPTAKDLQDADAAYGAAAKVMYDRAQRAKELQKTAWQWIYDSFVRVKVRRGDLGEVNQYRNVLAFLEPMKDDPKGGLKDKFDELEESVRAKLARAEAKSQKPEEPEEKPKDAAPPGGAKNGKKK